MSRVAKKPISVSKGIEITINGKEVSVNGPKGLEKITLHDLVSVKTEDNEIRVSPIDDSDLANAIAGTSRALLQNMLIGVTAGYEKKLTLVGVGYRAQIQGENLNLTLGFSHPVNFPMPKGITIETPQQTEIVIKGIDKQLVGQVAANIRRYRPVEPYKGKGIRYADEKITLKETKKK